MDKSRRSVIAAFEKRVEELGGRIEKNNACWTTETKGGVGGQDYLAIGWSRLRKKEMLEL